MHFGHPFVFRQGFAAVNTFFHVVFLLNMCGKEETHFFIWFVR